MSLRYGRHSADRVQPTTDDEESSYTTDDGTYAAAEDQATFTPRPTFTATSDDPATTVPVPALAPDDALPDDALAEDAPVADDTVVDDEPTVSDYPTEPDLQDGPDDGLGLAEPTQVQSVPATVSPAPSLDEPLFSDATELRARWQQVQAEFVDDPREAVGDAADLIEQTTQALVDALEQRQRDLRAGWDHGGTDGTSATTTNGTTVNGTTTNGTTDTERLRLMMQSYRALFNQLTRS